MSYFSRKFHAPSHPAAGGDIRLIVHRSLAEPPPDRIPTAELVDEAPPSNDFV